MIQKYKNHIIIISILKLFILFLLPLTGDEAYFIKWANHLDLGYYDHPPMIGWTIYIMQYISESYIFFRLFSFATVFVVAYFIYKILLEFNIKREKAIFSSILFILMPINILILLITNDIPLLLFGTIGSYFLLKSFRVNYIQNSILSGIFLGFSFLSKYFAVFLMLGLLIYLILTYKTKAIKNVLIAILTLSPFIIGNLYFNYNSCWNNIMFNFFARTENLHFNISTIIGYLIILIYLLTPWGIYYVLKSKDNIDKKLLKFIISSVGVGLGIFLMVSLKKKIGLHWVLLFMPYLFMLFIFIKDTYQNKFIKYNLFFTYFHITILLLILLLPNSILQKHKKYKDILLFTDTQTICKNISNYQNLFTTGYTSASILSYHCKKDIKMILNNSKYGRLDDKLVDIRMLQNQTINIFFKNKPNIANLKNIFQKVKINSIQISNQIYYIANCQNLIYENYKNNYIAIQKEKFYNIPSWLPIGDCYFYDRYYK
jgi:hypothetical protein